MNKKSDFSADLSAKNRFSGGMETILTKKQSEENKSAKNQEKSDIFPTKSDFFSVFSLAPKK